MSGRRNAAMVVSRCTYPLFGLWLLLVPLLQRVTLEKSPKVTKGLLPHHSAPRLGSVCPNEGLNPWAAATRHPWRGAANPASCRVTHGFKPAFGQRGLTGRLRSRSKARANHCLPDKWRSKCGSGLARECSVSVNKFIADPPHSRASPLPHFLTVSGFLPL